MATSLREQVDFAESRFHALKSLLDQLPAQMADGAAEVYSLPLSRDDGLPKDQPTPAEVRHIQVEPVRGPMALRMATTLYQQVRRRIHQPPTRPDRLPGIVMIKHYEAANLVKRINDAKDELRAAMADLPRMDSRSSTLLEGTDLQHVMLLQAYRHIDILLTPPDQVSFGWTRRSRVIRQMTREEAIEKVSNMDTGEDNASTRWLRALREIDDDIVAQVKIIPPSPVCNIRYTMGSKAQWSRRPSCTMPLLVIGTATPQIRPLTSFDADQLDAGSDTDLTSARADATLRHEPLIGAINLYRYKPECLSDTLGRREDRLRNEHALPGLERPHPFA